MAAHLRLQSSTWKPWRSMVRPWCLLLPVLVLLGCLLPPIVAGPEQYKSIFNKSSKYSARNVSRALVEEVIDDGSLFLFPLESSKAVANLQLGKLKLWQACFGPTEPMDLRKVTAGEKLPCFYKINQWGNYDYWEEHASDILLRTNCYCYSVARYVGSYCEPGLGGTGKRFPMPVRNCAASVAGVLADGGQLVSRETVYNVAPTGHYIALAVRPATDRGDSGDFHFWRLDSYGSWSYKAGDTLTRNTYRNGTEVRDIELAEPRGAYTEWCGYFEVWPETHKLTGNNYYYSSLPARYKLWQDLGVKASVTPLSNISPAWLAAYRSYFINAGWEDRVPKQQPAVDESGTQSAAVSTSTYRKPPHTYSVRPYEQPAGDRPTSQQPRT